MEAKGIEDVLTNPNKLTDKLWEAGKQLEPAAGEKMAVITARRGTTLSESNIRTTVKEWLTIPSTASQSINSVVVQVSEETLIHITR